MFYKMLFNHRFLYKIFSSLSLCFILKILKFKTFVFIFCILRMRNNLHLYEPTQLSFFFFFFIFLSLYLLLFLKLHKQIKNIKLKSFMKIKNYIFVAVIIPLDDFFFLFSFEFLSLELLDSLVNIQNSKKVNQSFRKFNITLS